MAQDQQTYRRAAHAALIGLGVQLLLAIVLALVGLYAGAPAIHAATWHLFGGLPIWLVLWVLYHQHQLERVEALEAEQFAQTDARAAALFDEAGDQLRVARKRLEGLNKWWLPAVSILVSVYLMAAGGGLLYAYAARLLTQTGGLDVEDAIAPRGLANAGMLTIVLVVIGFVAFLAARYVSGMTRAREWALLRGGASYLMGGVVAMLLLFVGGLFAVGGDLTLLAALALAIPALMVLLGLEMLLGFLFGLYRPRRPGEINRPAFDSRVLGLLTRPESIGKIINETINYQFGFEISKSWFYRLISRAVTPLILVGVVVLVGLTSVTIISPHQKAVVTTFGGNPRVIGPGLSWKWPWPVSRVERYDFYRVHQMAIGSEDDHIAEGVPVLWTNQHGENAEQYLVTAPTRFGPETESEVGDLSVELTGARVIVNYRLSDLTAYATSVSDPRDYLRAIATRRINRYFASHTIDYLLTEGRAEASETLQRQIEEDLAALPRPLGLEVVFVGFEAIHPPQDQDVAATFHAMVNARQEQVASMEVARQEAIQTLAEVAGSREMALRISEAIADLDTLRDQLEQARLQEELSPEEAASLEQKVARQEVEIERLLDEAGGRAAQMIYEARAYRWQRALGERGRAMRLAAQYESFQQVPEYFRRRMYLQTLAEALPNQRKTVIVGEKSGRRDIRIDMESQSANLGGLFNDE